jgi:hypothetical protein
VIHVWEKECSSQRVCHSNRHEALLYHERNSNPRAKTAAHMRGMDKRFRCDNPAQQALHITSKQRTVIKLGGYLSCAYTNCSQKRKTWKLLLPPTETCSSLYNPLLNSFFNRASFHEDVLGEWKYSSTHSLTSALDGGEWSASRPGRFIPRERIPGTHWIGGWVGPRAVLDAVVKRKIPSPRRELNPGTSIV